MWEGGEGRRRVRIWYTTRFEALYKQQTATTENRKKERKKNTEKYGKNIRKRITTMMRAQRRAAIKCSRTEHVQKKRIAPEDPQRTEQQQGREEDDENTPKRRANDP